MAKDTAGELITDAVTEYWQEYRQLPCSESFSEWKKHIIEAYDDGCGIFLKGAVELKNYPLNYMVATIHKLLKLEVE